MFSSGCELPGIFSVHPGKNAGKPRYRKKRFARKKISGDNMPDPPKSPGGKLLAENVWPRPNVFLLNYYLRFSLCLPLLKFTPVCHSMLSWVDIIPFCPGVMLGNYHIKTGNYCP
jgi:hypothetical protein